MFSEWLNEVRLRLEALLRRHQLERDPDDEFAFHLAKREEKYRAEGNGADSATLC